MPHKLSETCTFSSAFYKSQTVFIVIDDLSKSKAYKFLSTLTKAEQQSFDLFLRSPYFNQNEDLVAFSAILLDHLNQNSDAELQPETVFLSIYPVEPKFQGYKITRLSSALVTLFEEFNAQEANQQLFFFRKFEALSALGERGLLSEQERGLDKLEEELLSRQDSHFHYYAFRLSEYRLLNATHSTRMRSQDAIESAYGLLDTFQRIQKLRLLCAAINQSLITDGATPAWVFEAMPEFAAKAHHEEPLIELYQCSLKLLLDKTDLAWQALVAALNKHKAQFQASLMHEFYQQALNFQIRAYNQDQSDLGRCRLLLDFYMEMIAQNYILDDGAISAWNYKNIASLHARIGELDRLKHFMADFENRISGNDATNARNFVRGLLAFYEGRHENQNGQNGAAFWMAEVLAAGSENIFWELEARAFRLIIKFELGDYEDEMQNQESLRMFIDRNKKLKKISKEHHLAYGNLIKSLNKLHLACHLPSEKRENKFQKLQQEFSQKDFLAQKQWFLKKLDFLLA